MSARYFLPIVGFGVFFSEGLLAAQPLMGAPATVSATAVEMQKPWALEPVFGGGFGGGDGLVQGGVFGVIPLHSTVGDGGRLGGDLWFIEPRMNWLEEGATSQSLGLGFRRLFSVQSVAALDGLDVPSNHGFWAEGWYLGGNVFLDTLQSSSGFDYWQMGAGLEVGSRYVTLRANWYRPLTREANKMGEQTVERSRTTTSNSNEQGRYVQTPIPGRTDVVDTSVLFHRNTFTSTRVVNDVFSFYEQGTASWDVEASLLVPKLDRYTDLRLVTGLYGMDGGDYAHDVKGWRAGVEWRPVPSLALMATYLDDDTSERGHWFTGFRVEIPLGKTPSQLARTKPKSLVERLLEPTGRFAGAKVMHGVKVDRQILLYEADSTDVYSVRGDVSFNFGSVTYIYLNDGRIYQIQADGSVKFVGYGDPGLKFVPEPTRATLLLLGSLCLLMRRRRTH